MQKTTNICCPQCSEPTKLIIENSVKLYQYPLYCTKCQKSFLIDLCDCKITAISHSK
ncbi:cysteine-rich KTR domain-containing protein [Enterococcus sp. ALS3]|uniref:Cysteine-rich KTR domain-containing protein n=2 Tax=Enterococcus alishanensis TaxID=1303817 RepID=A0ABS6TGF1_9ENTE|nr:cysteine-rich KTR domain-containing protein [Enterococcus alishanensis]